MKKALPDPAVKELELLKTRYQLILDCAGEGIYGLDSEGNITFSNAAPPAFSAGKLSRYWVSRPTMYTTAPTPMAGPTQSTSARFMPRCATARSTP